MEPVAPVTLEGQHVRLEPLGPGHLDGLQAIIEGPRDTFGLTPVPQTRIELEAYVATALDEQRRMVALPFATLDARTGRVLGTTRFGNVEFWPIPPGSAVPIRPAGVPYAVEIGWTWLAPDVQRTAINTEAKYLLLRNAFDDWDVHRVAICTDSRNTQSRTAILRIGAAFEGILRSHRGSYAPGEENIVARDSAMYSVVRADWPEVKRLLEARLA